MKELWSITEAAEEITRRIGRTVRIGTIHRLLREKRIEEVQMAGKKRVFGESDLAAIEIAVNGMRRGF